MDADYPSRWVIIACRFTTPNEILRSGTWATIRHAQKLGRRVITIMPNGIFNDSDPEGKATVLKAKEDLIQRKLAMIAAALQQAGQVKEEPGKRTGRKPE